MKMPSDLFKPGSVGDALANDLAREFAKEDGFNYAKGHRFRIRSITEYPYRSRAELAITWMLQPDVREKLGGMK